MSGSLIVSAAISLINPKLCSVFGVQDHKDGEMLPTLPSPLCYIAHMQQLVSDSQHSPPAPFHACITPQPTFFL